MQQITLRHQLREQREGPILFPTIESLPVPCNMRGCGCLDICGDDELINLKELCHASRMRTEETTKRAAVRIVSRCRRVGLNRSVAVELRVPKVLRFFAHQEKLFVVILNWVIFPVWKSCC